MNIEKSIEILKAFRNYNKFYKEENKNLTITITLETKESIDKAIERLLTAYEKEKEKEKNKDLKEGYKIQEHNYQVAMEEIEQRWEDKIKAKVIEIKDRPVKDEFITATQGKLNTIIDIENLLDEEE